MLSILSSCNTKSCCVSCKSQLCLLHCSTHTTLTLVLKLLYASSKKIQKLFETILAMSSFQSQFLKLLIISAASFYTFSDLSISFRFLHCSRPHQAILTEHTYNGSICQVKKKKKKGILPQKIIYSNENYGPAYTFTPISHH